MENSTNLVYSKVIVQAYSGKYVKQIRARSHCPKISRIAKKNKMSSAKSVKTTTTKKITGPLVMREVEKKKEKLMVGQIKLYIPGIAISVE